MIFDFSYKTGITYSGMYSPETQENIDTNYLSSRIPIEKGKNSTNLSINGQMLAEQTAIETLISSTLYGGVKNNWHYDNSGDYYVITGNSSISAYLDNNSDLMAVLSGKDNYFYALRDHTGEIPISTGITQTGISSGVNIEMQKKFPQRYSSYSGMESFDYFLNGQKIYSGNLGSYDISGSTFIYDESIYGKVFAIPKNNGLKNYTGENPDVYNEEFVESTVFGFVNGIALNKINWVELYTGVKNIQTGVQCRFFEIPLETQKIKI